MTTYYQRRLWRLPREHEETFTAELFARGALGCEIRDDSPATLAGGTLAVEAYFPDPPPLELALWDLGAWPGRGVETLAAERFADRDWLAEYRAAARPLEVGRRFVVDPRDEAEAQDVGGRTVLAIPARTAFGTGSHESTRLAVAWLEDLDPRGLDVLDVGTGSGILAFAALRLGARRAVGFDADPGAALVARQNADLNRLRPSLFAGRLASLRAAERFDLALVNVLPERVLPEVPRLLPLLRPGARVVSSGNLWQRRRELAARFAALGLNAQGEKREGEWVAFLLRYIPP
jgi:ribosomal protein L11 methyltransferase